MPKIEPDSFEHSIRNHAKIIKSTMKGFGGVKKSYEFAKVSSQIQFGFNRKQDNQIKTKQLKLF